MEFLPIHPDALRLVAGYGLPGGALVRSSQGVVVTDALLAAAKEQRVTGLLWRAILDGHAQATAELAEATETALAQSLAGCLSLEHLLLDCVGRLTARGVDVRVLKGSAAAHLDYPDPSQRLYGDVDMLVRSADFDQAVRILSDAGHARRYPEPRPGFDRRFSKGTSFLTASGLEIDLHRTFSMGPFGLRLDMDELWRRWEAFPLAGQDVRSLSTEARFLHACYHAVLGTRRPRLVPLRDLAQIALLQQVDMAELNTLIAKSAAEPVVARAVRAAWMEFELADEVPVSTWAHTYSPTPRELAEMSAYDSDRSTYAGKSFAAIRALPSSQDRLAYIYALAFPDKSYVKARHAGRMSRLVRGFRQLSRGHHG